MMNPAEQRLKEIQTTITEINRRLKKLETYKQELSNEQEKLLRQLL